MPNWFNKFDFQIVSVYKHPEGKAISTIAKNSNTLNSTMVSSSTSNLSHEELVEENQKLKLMMQQVNKSPPLGWIISSYEHRNLKTSYVNGCPFQILLRAILNQRGSHRKSKICLQFWNFLLPIGKLLSNKYLSLYADGVTS